MYLKDKLIEFEDSVIELASKLPQWNSEDKDRRYNSAIFSLFEEAGEISGLISKKRIRKNYWKSNPKELEDYEEIRKAFIGELSDFLWVLTCTNKQVVLSEYSFVDEMIEYLDMAKNDEKDGTYDFNIEKEMLNLLKTLDVFKSFRYAINNVFLAFCYLLVAFNKEYDITLEELIDYNMEKLGKRYNEKGERVDGK